MAGDLCEEANTFRAQVETMALDQVHQEIQEAAFGVTAIITLNSIQEDLVEVQRIDLIKIEIFLC